MRNALLIAVAVSVLAAGAADAAGSGDLLYSVLFPGWGQMRAGRYGRGALLVSAEIISLTGLLMADIQYDRTVEQYDRARARYLTASYIGDARASYDTMLEKWDNAENLNRYRNAFLGAAIGVWAIGVVDMMWGGGGEPPVTLNVSRGGFIVARSFSF
jgi:hypothetical protein